MNRVKKGLDNQAIGLLPLLLFMFLDRSRAGCTSAENVP